MVRHNGQGLFFLFCVFLLSLTSAAPEYQFSFGRITGVDELAEDTLRPYNAYYGIPFALPPVRGLRFRAPQPFINGNNVNRVISSPRFKSACTQLYLPVNQTSEDCLYLNVFTPTSVNSGGVLNKVMVWIHGGGFRADSAARYVPSRLVTDYDVIVVTLQYRLGLFGFMNPGAGQDANLGLRDQLMAINWVKANIRQFGGDGDDITIFGESAGAISASLLSLSPLAKGLFTKVILQSGVLNGPSAVNDKPQEMFLGLAENLGCLSWLQKISSYIRDKYIDDIMNCLRQKLPFEILSQRSVGDFRPGTGASFGGQPSAPPAGNQTPAPESFGAMRDEQRYGPSIDGVVIPRNPDSLLADKGYLQANGVLDRTYMVGFNNAEGLLGLLVMSRSLAPGSTFDYSTFTKPDQAEEYVKSIAKDAFPYPVTDDVMDFVVYEYTYPRGEDGRVTDIMSVFNALGDSGFVAPAVQFARALTTISDTTPVYMFLFDHNPELIDASSPIKGSIHGLERVYEFDRSQTREANSEFYAKLHTPTDQPMYNILRNSLTQFAKTGVPSSQEYSTWPRFRPGTENYLAMRSSPEVGQRVYSKRMDLWTKILPQRAGQAFRSRRFRLY